VANGDGRSHDFCFGWYYAQQTALNLREKLSQSHQSNPQQLFNEAVDEAFDAELDKLFSTDDLF
jgi:hypothetical protein